MFECGPSGCRQSAPRTPRHHGAPGTVVAMTAAASCSLTNCQKTNDQPKLWASGTYPVTLTNAANFAFVTATGSIQNVLTSTRRTGPSPSAGTTSGSSAPIQNEPPGISTIPRLTSRGDRAGTLRPHPERAARDQHHPPPDVARGPRRDRQRRLPTRWRARMPAPRAAAGMGCPHPFTSLEALRCCPCSRLRPLPSVQLLVQVKDLG